jgi:signal transduction histidine kinase
MLTTELTKFREMNSYQLNDNSVISKAMKSFEDNTNSKIAIFSLNGDLKYLPTKGNSPTSEEVTALTAFCIELINNKELIFKVISTGVPETQIFNNKSSIGVISPMSLNAKNDSVVISVAPLQPIEEASDVTIEFFGYIFIGFIFISIFLSFIYSNLISKPLIKINNVALKMSKMDFTKKCVVESSDEIGNLATTLNFLSSNLSDSLEDLKRKNKKLELDIEKERNLEAMRKDFVDSVSHELKTPIGIIEGYAEGIKDGIVTEGDVLTYLETIIDESKKMGVLVSNMLELSKLESGALKPKPEIFNINRLINKVIHKHLLDASEKQLNLTFNENTEYSYVLADIFQMDQVLTNLITNAIKYTSPNNDIIISINDDGDRYKLSVINLGSNIDSKNIDKLFDKFYRIDKARQRDTNSTGLGLSIVKNILDLHNFEYSLENIENGVCFTYYLLKEELKDD